jgi:DNA-binding MarR family transcriptional regulator
MTDDTGEHLKLEEFLPYRLSILSNTVSRAIANSYAERFDLSISEWRVIAVLCRFPGISAAQVAERTAMGKVAVSRAVSRLINADRIQRRFADADRRRSILELTEQGHAIYDEIRPIAQRYEDTLLNDMSDAEKRQLDALLTKLTNTAETLKPKSGSD